MSQLHGGPRVQLLVLHIECANQFCLPSPMPQHMHMQTWWMTELDGSSGAHWHQQEWISDLLTGGCQSLGGEVKVHTLGFQSA